MLDLNFSHVLIVRFELFTCWIIRSIVSYALESICVKCDLRFRVTLLIIYRSTIFHVKNVFPYTIYLDLVFFISKMLFWLYI